MSALSEFLTPYISLSSVLWFVSVLGFAAFGWLFLVGAVEVSAEEREYEQPIQR